MVQLNCAVILIFLIIIINLYQTLSNELPNIILIYLDDTGFGDISIYNQTCHQHIIASDGKVYNDCPLQKTPAIDQIARDGALFTQFYSAHCVCSPSRAAILTGRYPIRSGVFPGVFNPSSTGGLPNSSITIAEALKAKDYKTFMVGKWHLGHLTKHLPINHGFDKWYGLPYSHDYCPCGKNLVYSNDANTCRPQDPTCPFYYQNEIIEQPAFLPNLTYNYTRLSIDILEEEYKAQKQNHSQKPFFLYLAFSHTHHPQFSSINFVNSSARGPYGDAIRETDFAIGNIMEVVRKYKNTLVILSSDNGPSLIRQRNGGSAGELRCGKGTTYEGGQRVPGIFYWPEAIPSSQIITSMASTLDVFPTLLSIANIKYTHQIDGIDLSSLLFKSSKIAKHKIRENFFYYGLKGHLYAARVKEYKAHYYTSSWGDSSPQLCGHNTKYQKHDPPLLYNIVKDPGETTPISSKSSEYKTAMKLINDAVANHNCSKQTDACAGTNQISPQNPHVEPWNPGYLPWTPKYASADIVYPTEPHIY